MQTIQQRRAKYALDQVQNAKSNSGIDNKEYKSYANALPAMIHTNGLGQATAFYKSKGGTHKALYNLLSGWLCKDAQIYSECSDLMEGITGGNMRDYRLAQAEAVALMDWAKKFANAYMSEQEQEDKQESADVAPV